MPEAPIRRRTAVLAVVLAFAGVAAFLINLALKPPAFLEEVARLSQSALDSEREKGLARLKLELKDLPDGTHRLQALELQRKLCASLGQAGDATISAESACAVAERMRREDPDSVSKERMVGLYLRTAECFNVEGAREKVDEYFAKARRVDPGHAEVLAADAEQLYVSIVHAIRDAGTGGGQPGGAVSSPPEPLRSADPRLEAVNAKLDAALAKDANCYRALVLRARVSESTGGVLSAIPFYESAIAAAPLRADAHVLLARLYIANDQSDLAVACVQKALQKKVDDPALHYMLGNIYAAQGRRGEARRYLEAYLKNRPGNRSAAALLANLLSAEALGKQDQLPVEELEILATRIRELNPDDPKGLLVQASVLTRRKPRQYVEAIVLLEKAQGLMPGSVEVVRELASAHRNYGYALMMAGKKDLGMDHFKAFLAIAPRDVPTEAARTALHAHCKSLEKKAREQIGRGDAEAAEASCRRSIDLVSGRPGGHFHLGIIMRREKPELALVAFEEALRLGRERGEDVSFFFLPLLGTLQAVGKADEAKRRAEAFLKDPGPRADRENLDRIRDFLK